MVKGTSVLLTDVSDDKLQSALALGALPRIRMYFMTAVDGNGNHLFYDALGDLANSVNADAAEALIDLLIEESTIKNAVRKIAANFAAASLIASEGGSFIAGELSLSKILDKQGVTELEKLTVSPLMRSAITSASTKLAAAIAAPKAPAVLYVALGEDTSTKDIDLNTVDGFAGAELPYSGAPEAGVLGVIVNGVVVEITVVEGDTPVDALNKLFVAFEALSTNTRPNVVLALNEKANWIGSRKITFVEPISSDTVTESFTITTAGAYMTILPRKYETDFDMVVATIYAKSRDPLNHSAYISGIPGFIYGIAPTLSELTYKGPHAIAADLTQGKVTVLSSSSDSATADPVSDSFFFRIDADTTSSAGSLVYRVNEHTARTVAIPSGSSALDIATLLATDMAASVDTQRILGAVRPSTSVTTQGTPEAGPSLAMVAFGLEADTINIIVTIQSVPAGVVFGIVQANTLTLPLFDALPKSIIVKTTINRPILHAAAVSTPGSANTGTTFKVTHTKSATLTKLLDNFTLRGR